MTFITMELFVICLLIWRPVTGFLIHTTTYLIFFHKLDSMAAFNTGTEGLTLASQINGFTLWLSTLMFCIANYNKTMSQAIKDENLEKVNSQAGITGYSCFSISRTSSRITRSTAISKAMNC